MGVLGRAVGRNQGGVDGCAALEQQALGGQRAVDGSQYLNAELVLFEQVAKAQDAHAIRNALSARETSEVTVQRRLEQCLFHGQVRQAEPLLQKSSEEHTSELQSLMRISYAVFCLKKKKTNK